MSLLSSWCWFASRKPSYEDWSHFQKGFPTKTFFSGVQQHISRFHLFTPGPPSSQRRSLRLPSWGHRFIFIPPQWSSSSLPSSVLRHGAKSRLSHQPPSWGEGSAKCHLSWQGLQVGCNHAGTVVSGPESGIFLLDTEMRSGFSEGWESSFGQSSVPLSFSVLFAPAPCFLCLSSLASWSLGPSPLTSHFYLFCCYLTRQDFVFPGIPPLFIFWGEGRKRGWGIESL